MDQISFSTVAKVFQDLIAEQFPDETVQEITEEHKQIAQLLVEKLQEISFQYTFVEESDNEKGTVFGKC